MFPPTGGLSSLAKSRTLNWKRETIAGPPTEMYVMPGALLNNSPSLVLTPTPKHTIIANQNLLTARPTAIRLTTAQCPSPDRVVMAVGT